MGNFIPIQQDQGVAADGYEINPVSTGYDYIVGQRTTDLFCTTAEDDGKITDVTPKSIEVTYKDGTVKHVELGLRLGKAAGVMFPHEVITNLKKGDKVKRGDAIAFNKSYFTFDRFNPTRPLFKNGLIVHTVLIDDIDTLEDGSSLSKDVADQMVSHVVEPRIVEVRFDQKVSNVVKTGDHVDLDSILCTIEDSDVSDGGFFDEVSMDTLRRLSSVAPRSGVHGKVVKIECFYHGEFDELNPTLQELAKASDRERKKTAKALGQPYFTGQVDTSFRIEGNGLELGNMAICIYIDHAVPSGTGDKFVFANQLKSTVSSILDGKNVDAYGNPIQAKFGNISIEARAVHSPKKMGTAITFLKVLSKQTHAVYRGDKDGD